MAVHVIRATDVTVNGIDLTTRVNAATLNITTDAQEFQLMTEDWMQRLHGVKDWNVSVTYLQDFATGSVDATHWDIFSAYSTFVVKVLPSGSTTGSANPAYSGTVILTEYAAIDATRGEVHQVAVTYAGAGTLTRATA